MKYQIIYADPPWKYNSRANHKTRFRGGANGHYDLMTMKDIKSLPIASIVEGDAVLFLWVTFPFMEEQLKVFKAWGFQYKTVGFTWIKLNANNMGTFFGVGYYTKSNAEVCLLGTRGKVLKPVRNDIGSVIISPRQEHSRKPIEVRDRISLLYPDCSRIELFARRKVEGWDAWGNEVESDIELGKALW